MLFLKLFVLNFPFRTTQAKALTCFVIGFLEFKIDQNLTTLMGPNVFAH